MNPTYLIVAAACVVALAIRTTFELLQERGRMHPRNKAVFALVFVLYSRLAHPMYAGFLLWIAGWVMAYGAVISLAVGLVAIGCVLSWRRLEDVALESSYREDYRLYRSRTWF